jgi:anhydro-N-acetylmuramic acid kinase
MSPTPYYIGLISGTSVDGIDCVLVDCEQRVPRLVHARGASLDRQLRQDILRLCEGDNIDLPMLGQTHIRIGQQFAAAVNALLEEAEIDASRVRAIGSHGQTVWHQPDGEAPFTLQLGDPNTIAQLTGISTVADFRGRDMAAGGQGAPLAPLLHRQAFHSQNVDRAIINIGGISNITVLPRQGDCLAFDSGPGNVLMDYWVNKQLGKDFDENGEFASQGMFNLSLLNALLDEEYLRREIPKSTGRELFNGQWLEGKLRDLGPIKPEDVQATLLTFTVTTLVSGLSRYSAPQEIYICGGGAHNKALMEELGKVASDYSVLTTAELGIDPDWVEAIAFAWMGKEAIAGRPIDTSPFTGAKEPVYLGGIYRGGGQSLETRD